MSSESLLLKEACALTETRWAAVLALQNSSWQPREIYPAGRFPQTIFQHFLEEKNNRAWLSGAFNLQRVRSRRLTESTEALRLYAFPCADAQTLLLTACERSMPVQHQRVWRMTSLALQSESQSLRLQQAVRELEETQQELQARIAAQHEAESRLVQAAKLAAVGEMAAGIAHELNNPLTSVVGFTELSLEALPPDSSLRPDLDLVLREAQRARSVVRRLLDFARQSESLRVRADLNEIVEDVIALTKHLLHTSGVTIVSHLTTNLPWVSVDRNQMKQVLINLINNALYAMPQGGALTLATSLQPRYESPWLCMEVSDTGIGIPAENLGRIFEPFFTTRGQKGGTGLGLSVTYGIVTEHGGAIEVQSAPGSGSTFRVWLPLEETP